ncbi:hypothetical protein KCP76_14495 [Salmonella enterica subsp. enterica serovar Weltevreden]|nr:hypothetical protein KCP76_14495 [Salmonella enterica subsp. enterica serovar Weltevreden]
MNKPMFAAQKADMNVGSFRRGRHDAASFSIFTAHSSVFCRKTAKAPATHRTGWKDYGTR